MLSLLPAYGALEVLCDWLNAKNLKQKSVKSTAANLCNLWHRPPDSFVKCNIDVAVFRETNQAGVAAIFCDSAGCFFGCESI